MLVKYGEISLRKGNRAFFEYHLMDIIRAKLKPLGKTFHVKREQGRFVIEDPEGDVIYNEVIPRIKNIFGLIGFAYALQLNEKDTEKLYKCSLDYFVKYKKDGETFRVQTKRADKKFPLTSNEVSAEIGSVILENISGLKVDLFNPEITFNIEIRNNIYIYFDSEPGEGGLPYGSTGKAVLMLSGGFDSPVAGYLCARRGVEILPLYFHSPPFVSERSLDKVMDLCKVLSEFTGKLKLIEFPFTDIQLFLKDNIPEAKLTLLMKRSMLKISSLIANENKAHGIITGDAIGQVSSQTLHSLAALNSASDFPIIRPLAAMDKQDIINIATRIGTQEISIRPYDDCCTLFLAKHPETKPNRNVIEKIEHRLGDELIKVINDAMGKIKIHEV